MAVGLSIPDDIFPVEGIRLGSIAAGIRYQGRDDLVLMELAEGSTTAAVFTQNAFCAAPVMLAKQHLACAMPRYLLINSGNANAGTGKQGMLDAARSTSLVAGVTGCNQQQVMPFSTGVIAENLPMAAFEKGIPQATKVLDESAWETAAAAIMTTDTVPKLVSRCIDIQGHQVTVTAMAKGSGMIRPDMATMLAFIGTDAAVSGSVLQACLQAAVNDSFNLITVDGDTSTNDACVVVATGKSAMPVIGDLDSPEGQAFYHGLLEVCQELAQACVRDGEGATKFVTVAVENGASREECHLIAETIANSPLVKTALFASDPNWGRILAAVGRAGVEDLEIAHIDIYLGDVCIVQQGGRAPAYQEQQGLQVMSEDEITIRVVLNRGTASLQVWTCDFSYDYVRINAEYRT